MKKVINTLVALCLAAFMLSSCGTESKTDSSEIKFVPPVSKEIAIHKADSIVSIMSLDEKLGLIKGHKGFFIKGYEKYGMPDVYLTDASQGVNIRHGFHGANLADYALPRSVAFPNTLELAATWNPQLAHEYAKSIGEECRAAGIGVLLGPGMNIYRQSQNGRNFEYFGEDPYLASRMVEHYVVGVQNTGVIATLKHFVANNTDYKRRASNSVIDERTLNEIYMPAFKSGVDAGAMAVMTSYNLINGEWAGQSEYVINELLRGQLGFENLVMTDWWSVNDTKKLVKSGQDLEMPGGESMSELKSFVENGEVDEKDIDRMCKSIITTIAQMGFLNGINKDESFLDNFEKHEEVALNTAREGIILLKNKDNILPIEEGSEKHILLTGIYVTENIYGGGSGQVAGYDVVTIIDALKKIYPNIQYSEQPTEKEIKAADIVMVSVGTWDYEGCDRHFSLPAEQEQLVQRCSKLNEKTMVIVNSGGGIRMTDWDNIAAIVYNWYPGQLGNVALAEVLSGKTNPSGKLPMTIEKEFADGPAAGYLPEGGRFMCDVEGYYDINLQEPEINRWNYDINIENSPDSLYDVKYDEGVLVGYRWFDTKNVEPLYPFGFGLSYTSFEVQGVKLSPEVYSMNGELTISAIVKNTGSLEGATVVQVYIGEQSPSVVRPVKELKGFEKIVLQPGESKEVSISLNNEAFAYWDSKSKQWVVNTGAFDVHVGLSSRDIAEKLTVVVK